MIAGTPDRRRWGEVYDWLADHLSVDDLAELIRRHGGRLMRVPSRLRPSRREMEANVLRALRDGATYTGAAEAAGIGRATAFRCANVPRQTHIHSETDN